MIERPRAWRGVRWAKWAMRRGAGLQREGGFYGYPVNRWGIKRPPNGTKFDRRPTGDVPRPLEKSRPISRMFFSRSRKETRGVRCCMWECRIAKRTTGKMLGCMRRTRMQNEMHMMTWQYATRKQMTWQRWRITGGHLAQRIRGVTTLLH